MRSACAVPGSAAGSSNAAPAWCWWTASRSMRARARPSTVVTVEGLARGEKLHPLQQAFLDEQAGQCGYCLSGILMSAKALLDRNPRPSRADIVAALDRHLCRCGVHNRIIRAVERAAAAHEATP